MRHIFLIIFFAGISLLCFSQKDQNNHFSVIAYYAGRSTMVDSFPIEKLTHIIFSFCHLKGDSLAVMNSRDSMTIQRMVELKKRNPSLKVMLSLGGWGGCKTCSGVFATKKGRKTFAKTAKQINDYFKTDGIDMDWEYPVIEGFPGHPYSLDDKNDFILVIKRLRKKLGKKNEISFAAGGFSTYIDTSIDWKKVMPLVNRVNLMSYDLGSDGTSAHHTPLYSNAQQTESVDHGVKMLVAAGVPPRKIAIGAAFYTKMYRVGDTTDNGLYVPAKLSRGFPHRYFDDSINTAKGFTKYWDSTSLAPYAFNERRMLFATYDDSLSIAFKTQYAIKNHLNGIMFWQLADDSFTNGLLDAIDNTVKYDESETTKAN